MPPHSQGKHVQFRIHTSQEALDRLDATLDDVKVAVQCLARCFGQLYERFFPVNISTGDIGMLLEVSRVVGAVEDFPGFKRHIRGYSKASFADHIFTARTAAWLAGSGKGVEFEPRVSSVSKKTPDLRCYVEGEASVFVECKRIRTQKFYDMQGKQRLADLIYERLPTCDQLNFYLLDNDLNRQS